MRFPKSLSIGIRVPFVRTPALPALGPGSMSSLLGVALGAAYWILALLTCAAVLIFLFIAFVPMGPLDLIATSEDGGTSVPVPRAYFLFGVGAFAGYFAGFALILRHLRRIVYSLRIGDPFQPANVSRLKQIGLTLATVTGGAWIGQTLVSRLVRGALEVIDTVGLVHAILLRLQVMIVPVTSLVFSGGH